MLNHNFLKAYEIYKYPNYKVLNQNQNDLLNKKFKIYLAAFLFNSGSFLLISITLSSFFNKCRSF